MSLPAAIRMTLERTHGGNFDGLQVGTGKLPSDITEVFIYGLSRKLSFSSNSNRRIVRLRGLLDFLKNVPSESKNVLVCLDENRNLTLSDWQSDKEEIEDFTNEDTSAVTPEMIAILQNKYVGRTQYEAKTNARRGQSEWVKLIRPQHCPLTGSRLGLIGSHIADWAKFEEARLHPENGFLFTRNIDWLFERGWISFDDNGNVLLSPQRKIEEFDALGLTEILRQKNIGPFSDERKRFLAWHRKNKFRA